MLTITYMIFLASLKLLVALIALVYAGLVLTAYQIEGPHYQPRLELLKPARSGERLLVWTGVKLLDAALRMGRSLLNQLFLASADVGAWVVDKSSPEVQRRVRSRFL